MTGITSRQKECLDFIDRSIRENGISPSFEEIGAAINLKHKSTVHTLVARLIERGYVIRTPGKYRSLAIVQRGDRSALDILPKDSRNFLIGFARAEGKTPEVLMSEWIRQRCEEEHKIANNYTEFRSA